MASFPTGLRCVSHWCTHLPFDLQLTESKDRQKRPHSQGVEAVEAISIIHLFLPVCSQYSVTLAIFWLLIAIFAATVIHIDMKKIKRYRADGTRLLVGGRANPKLGAKLNKDKTETLFLDYYGGYHKEYSERVGHEVIKKDRKRERLEGLFLYAEPADVVERQHNKDAEAVAMMVRTEKEKALQEGRGYAVQRDVDVLTFMAQQVERADNKPSRRAYKQAYDRFMAFLRSTPEYRPYSTCMKPKELTREVVEDYTDYLRHISKGDGAATTFKRFKVMINRAVSAGLFHQNPCKGVTISTDKNKLTKDILSPSELRRLTAAPCTHHGVRQAFLFSAYTGIRYCDVKALTWANVDVTNRRLTFEQAKTSGHSGSSVVVLPLSAALMRLMGEPCSKGEHIFDLPCHDVAQKHLSRWVAAAGISKHITWHCARHSFAVNLLSKGVDVKTVSSLLGHSSIAMTEKYLHVVDSVKVAAINNQDIEEALL